MSGQKTFSVTAGTDQLNTRTLNMEVDLPSLFCQALNIFCLISIEYAAAIYLNYQLFSFFYILKVYHLCTAFDLKLL
jgi:hypothetical protein